MALRYRTPLPATQPRNLVTSLAPPKSQRWDAHSPSAQSARWDAVDAARGIAIAAMVVYHFAWDLSFLKLIVTNTITDPGWKAFARTIAGTFLTLVGVGLALAHAQGVRQAAFLKRLAKIGGAALLVTVATVIAFPQSYIFFGILHCIAAASVIALPFLRAPWFATLLAALACFVAPRVLTQSGFDHPALEWLGLGREEPITNDYVPLFPWLGVVLLGLLAGQALVRHRERLAFTGWRAENPLSRLLVQAGRWSLPIYLVHQPILLALLYSMLQITGPNPVAEAAPFIRQCTAGCVETRGDEALCRAACSCTAERSKPEGLWQGILANRLDPEERLRVNRIAQACLSGSVPRAP
jgi:uncharacterized membrane protein